MFWDYVVLSYRDNIILDIKKKTNKEIINLPEDEDFLDRYMSIVKIILKGELI